MKTFRIAAFPGDGIGLEVTSICVTILESLADHFGDFALDIHSHPAGASCYQQTGNALPQSSIDAATNADAILLGAMGLPDIRYEDGTEIAPQLDLRFMLNLYAGVRPVKPLQQLPLPLRLSSERLIDFILIRESTEGLFASHGKGIVTDNSVATDTMVITREVSEKLFDFSFKLARQRALDGKLATLTCVDKANVFASMAFFRKIFDEVSDQHADVQKDYMYVDAAALNMVKQPWNLGVLVTENMFGDILSDLGAGLMGGMGMAPSADIGDEHAVFQPCHGSAPDIAGQGKANPIAMILSGAMLLEWLGRKHHVQSMKDAAKLIEKAVEITFSRSDIVPLELGGAANTRDIHHAFQSALDHAA